NTPAHLVDVYLNGTKLSTSQFVVNPTLDNVGLYACPGACTSAEVDLHHTTVEHFTIDASGVVHLSTHVDPGDVVSATVNGAPTTNFAFHSTSTTTTNTITSVATSTFSVSPTGPDGTTTSTTTTVTNLATSI